MLSFHGAFQTFVEGKMTYDAAYNPESNHSERRVMLKQVEKQFHKLWVVDHSVASIKQMILEILFECL